MVEKTKNVEEKTWKYQGKEFKHCPNCGKGIPAEWNSHQCGWNLNEEEIEDFHVGDRFIKKPNKISDEWEKKTFEKQQENKFWKTKIESFTGLTAVKLAESLTEFGDGRFVIATQIYPMDINNKRFYDAFVYYKVSPEEK